MKLHSLAAIAASASLAAAQVGTPPPTGPELSPWPQAWWISEFAPVVDVLGRPIPTFVRALGHVDFDRDGHRDLWLMTEPTPGQTQMHTLLANTADLGRFWGWGTYTPSNLRDAATWGSTIAIDMVLAVEPSSDSLLHHFFAPNTRGPDPRIGGFWGRNPGWVVGFGCYEIETANHDRNDHDDLLVLRDAGGGQSEVTYFHMAAPFGGMPSPQSQVSSKLPWHLESLRALDFDGDRITDALVFAPGVGVLVLRGTKTSFVVADFLALSGGLRDLAVGDLEGDGRDEAIVTLDAGVLVLNGTSSPRVLLNPPGSGPLAGARVLDFDRSGSRDVVGLLASGDSLLVHLRRGAGFLPPILHQPESFPTGPGPLGQSMLQYDVDKDGDDDVIVQMADGGFVALRSQQRSHAPLAVNVVHEGRFNESYIAERLDFALPSSWQHAGIDGLEIGIYMRHPTNLNRPWVLWGHTTMPVAPGQTGASLRLLYLVDLSKLWLLTSAYLFQPQGFAVSGDTLLSVHGKAGQQRFESMLVFHEGRGDENKSTLGVHWKVIAAPPLPRADAQLLPF
jgi:hypothetical protein